MTATEWRGRLDEEPDDLPIDEAAPRKREARALLGSLLVDQGDLPGAIREFGAVVAHRPIDPAEAHYQLARAYRLNHQDEPAREELLSALESAPGYRPAQKLLLELSAAETSGTPRDPLKK